MKGTKLILCAVCAFLTVVAAITAIVMFRNEIADFFADVLGRIEDNRYRNSGEFADYADL